MKQQSKGHLPRDQINPTTPLTIPTNQTPQLPTVPTPVPTKTNLPTQPQREPKAQTTTGGTRSLNGNLVWKPDDQTTNTPHTAQSVSRIPDNLRHTRDLVNRAVMGFPPTTPLPETVRVGHRFRPFQDGGGRCSPGRYRPERRPTPPLSAILPLLTPIVTKHSLVDNFESLRRDSFGRQPIPTPSNRRPETYKPKSQITSDIRQETLWTVDQHIKSRTPPGTTPDFSIPPHQPFPLTALGQVLLHAKDKAHNYPAYLRDNRGPVGVDEDLPQAPAVFPNDETKAEHADIHPLRDDLDNYPSAIDAMREV